MRSDLKTQSRWDHRAQMPYRWDRWKPVQFILYLLLRISLMMASMFPPSTIPTLACLLSEIVRRVDRRHRRVAERNLLRAGYSNFVEMTRRLYDHFCRCAIEIAFAPRLHDNYSRWVELRRFEILDQQLSRGKGVILVGGHLGNWELAGLAMAAAGYRLNSVVRPIRNPYIDRWLSRSRRSTGRILIKYRALSSMNAVLRQNGILFVLVDQYAKSKGEWIDFFGGSASTTRSPALLSLRTGAPIIPLNIYRERDRHFAVVGDPIEPDLFRGRADPIRDLTRTFTAELEKYIRLHPEQWNWLHDRWKTPTEAGRAGRI